jgi:hypothetical protein
VVHLINLAHTGSIMEPPSPTVITDLDAGFDLIIRAVEALDVAPDPSAQVQADIDLALALRALVSKDHMDTATARDEMSCMDPFVAMQLHSDELKCTFNTPAVSDGVYVYEVRHVEEVCPPPISLRIIPPHTHVCKRMLPTSPHVFALCSPQGPPSDAPRTHAFFSRWYQGDGWSSTPCR